MTATREITVRLFGACRDLSTTNPLRLQVPTQATVTEVKKIIADQVGFSTPVSFDSTALIEKSALANSQRVLTGQEVITDSEFSILPPVCGG